MQVNSLPGQGYPPRRSRISVVFSDRGVGLGTGIVAVGLGCVAEGSSSVGWGEVGGVVGVRIEEVVLVLSGRGVSDGFADFDRQAVNKTENRNTGMMRLMVGLLLKNAGIILSSSRSRVNVVEHLDLYTCHWLFG